MNHWKKLMLSVAFIPLYLSNALANTNISGWEDLATGGDITFTQDITADNSNITLKVEANKIIDAENYALNGASLQTSIKTSLSNEASLTLQNFGKVSNGTVVSNDFYYTNTDGTIEYKKIDSSVNEFEAHPFIINNGKAEIKNSVFYNNKSNTSGIDGGSFYAGSNLSIENSFFINNHATSSKGSAGGAIYAYNDKTIDKIKKSVFIGNESNHDGGAIDISGRIKSIENSIFERNKSNRNSTIQGAGGGAIHVASSTYSDETLRISNSSFRKNSVLAAEGGAMSIAALMYTDIQNSVFEENSAATGGAVSSRSFINYIEDSTFKNNTAKDKDSSYGGGGALWLSMSATDEFFGKTTTIANSLFENNKAHGIGGAIYALDVSSLYSPDEKTKQTLAIVDTNFIGNSSDFDGGAIYTTANLNIYADKKDVLFDKNTIENTTPSDIYIEVIGQNSIDINLSAGTEKKITFNGKVGSWEDYVDNNHISLVNVNINKEGQQYTLSNGETNHISSTGEIVFNDIVEYVNINLYGGKLSIGQNTQNNANLINPNGYINNSNLFIKGDSILNTLNGIIEEINPILFEVETNTDLTYQFDIDLENQIADKLIGLTNNGTVTLDMFNIFKDMPEEQDEVKIVYADTNIGSILKDGYSITTSLRNYNIYTSNEDTGSYLIITKGLEPGGLAGAVYTEKDAYSITSNEDEIVDTWVKGSDSNVVKTDLVVNANNQGIISNTGIEGMIVENGITLTVNNAETYKGFDTAIRNNGTTHLNNVNFSENTGEATIVNNGTTTLTNGSFSNNTSEIALINNATTDLSNVSFNKNTGEVTIVNSGTTNLTNVNFSENTGEATIVNNGGEINLDSVMFDNTQEVSIKARGGQINIIGISSIGGDIVGQDNATMNIRADADIHNITDTDTTQSAGNVNLESMQAGSYRITDGQLNIASENNFMPNNLSLGDGTLNTQNNVIGTIAVNILNLEDTTNFMLDVDLANKVMDTITANQITSQGQLNISDLKLISDSEEETTIVNFSKDGSLLSHVDYTGITTGLTALSPVYTYDVSYDKENGDFIFTHGGGSHTDDFNPSVYSAPSNARIIASLQQDILRTVFENLGSQSLVPEKQNADKGNVWTSVFGVNDDIKFDSFNKVDSKIVSLLSGFNSNKFKVTDKDVTLGVYAGYVAGKEKYTGNEIDQEGGYIGLNSALEKDNLFLGATIQSGILSNKAKHAFGNDKYHIYWTGIALKGCYDYHLTQSVTIQPNIYTGYTFVKSDDYTSKSGAIIRTDNLNLLEAAPGVKIKQLFADNWVGYAEVKYAFISEHGGNTNVNEISLPNIGLRDYVEYGLGLKKEIRDNWGLSASINRRDAGRQGWNGSLTVKYNF